jgi:hypothetical protein
VDTDKRFWNITARVVGDADHAGIGDRRMGGERPLDFFRPDPATG